MKKTLLTAILTLVVVVQTALPAHAAKQEFGVMPDGYTFEVEDAGTYIFDFNGGSADKSSNQAAEDETGTTTRTKSVDISGYAEEVVRLTNARREKAGLEPLEIDDELMEMAQQRADEIVSYYSHTRPDGSRCFTVFDDFGCDIQPMNENIANGQASPEKVVAAWMKSDGHREAILREESQYIGAAVAQGKNGKLYWVQIFGR